MIRKRMMTFCAAVVAAGCGGGSESIQPAPEPIVLSGVVRDSLAQRGIPDMAVVFGDSGTVTEADGSFELNVAPGTRQLMIGGLNPLYGTITRTVTVTADQSLGALFPLRQAPYVSDFVVLPNGTIEATVSHQAGAAAARRPETWLVVDHGLASQSSTYPSAWWNWAQSGPRSWRVNLPLAQPGVQNAFFNVYGPTGVQSFALCSAATGQCANDSF